MPKRLTRRISRRQRTQVEVAPEQLESRRLLTSEISGAVFHDANGDGIQDTNDPGVAGVLISLTGQTDAGEAVNRRFLTAADGAFVFGGLQAGTYEVSQAQPSSITDGSETTGHAGIEIGNDRFSNIVVGTDDVVGDLHFAEGNVSDDLLSPLWLLASAADDGFAREMRATIEEDAGNADLAEAIRSGATEVSDTFDLNQAPIAAADTYSVDAGESLTPNAANGVLSNDSDPENSAIVATLVEGPQGGTLTLNTDGSFNYQPTGSFVGTDTFTYLASDGFKTSETVTVSITVVNPNTFTVAASAVEGDTVGTIETIQELDSQVLYDFVNESIDSPEFNLVPDDHMIGIASSPVVLMEYVDFACPACARYHPIMQQLTTDETGEVLIVYRYFPNLTGSNAVEAARAVEAASRQDNDGEDVLFSAMMDVLFDNQSEWTTSADPIALFEQYINDENISLDVTQWRTDLESQSVIDRVQRDFDQANALNLPGTPVYVLQGQRIDSPAVTIEAFDQVLDPAIAAARDNAFRLDRLTGQLEVLTSSNLDPENSPAEFQVRATDGTSEELLPIEVEITV